MGQIRDLCRRFLAAHEQLHGLINNAGIMVHQRYTAPDGAELTFAVNTRAYALLAEGLRPALQRSGDGRIVMVSSGGMYPVPLQLFDPHFIARAFDGVRAYAESKRAEVVLATWLANRYREDHIAVHSMHPGWVDTAALRQGLPRFYRLFRPLLRSPDQGADTAVWLVLSADGGMGHSGNFWHDRQVRPMHRRRKTRQQPGDGARLWAVIHENIAAVTDTG